MTDKKQTEKTELERYRQRILSRVDVQALVPDRFRARADDLVTLAAMYLQTHREIFQCAQESILHALRSSFEAGLPLDGRLASIIRFRDQAVFVPGYLGLIGIVRQEGLVEDIQAYLVHANDEASWDTGRMSHKCDPFGDRGPIVGGYCRILLPSGREVFPEPVSIEWLEGIRRKAPASDKPGSPWNTHREEMYRKTILKRPLKMFADNPRVGAAIRDEDQVYQDAAESSRVVELGDLPSTREGVMASGAARQKPEPNCATLTTASRSANQTKLQGDTPSRPSNQEVEAIDFFSEEATKDELPLDAQWALVELRLDKIRQLGWPETRIKGEIDPLNMEEFLSLDPEERSVYSESIKGHLEVAERDLKPVEEK